MQGRKFTLITDNKPLMSIFGNKKGIPLIAASRLQRWTIILSAYQYDIKFIKSQQNSPADALARLPLPYQSNKKLDAGHILYLQDLLPITYKTSASDTRKDKILCRVYNFCSVGWPDDVNNISEPLKPYYIRRNELYLVRIKVYFMGNYSNYSQ